VKKWQICHFFYKNCILCSFCQKNAKIAFFCQKTDKSRFFDRPPPGVPFGTPGGVGRGVPMTPLSNYVISVPFRPPGGGPGRGGVPPPIWSLMALSKVPIWRPNQMGFVKNPPFCHDFPKRALLGPRKGPTWGSPPGVPLGPRGGPPITPKMRSLGPPKGGPKRSQNGKKGVKKCEKSDKKVHFF